jgi:hypothetical protein
VGKEYYRRASEEDESILGRFTTVGGKTPRYGPPTGSGRGGLVPVFETAQGRLQLQSVSSGAQETIQLLQGLVIRRYLQHQEFATAPSYMIHSRRERGQFQDLSKVQ